MKPQKYVVLRVPGRSSTEVLAEARAGATSVKEVRVDVETLSNQDAKEARAHPESLGVAPVMPVVLIAPRKADGPAAADESTSTWGLQAVGALDSPFTGAGVTVAVLDTGIDAGHEAFQGRQIVQKDFTGEGNGDGNGHGTHCAGTIFGGKVGNVRVGIAQGVAKALIGKVLDAGGGGSTEQILDGVMWATREGANVISMSIGFDFPGLVRRLVDSGVQIEPATSMALAAYRENVRLFDTLAGLVRAHGAMFNKTVIVAAAGNESERPSFVIGTAPPAAADGFLSVGALGRGAQGALEIAPFSNGLPDLAAPGVKVSSAKAGGGLLTISGTSMATPHVAGVAALWFEKVAAINPAFKTAQIEGHLVAGAILNTLAPGQDLADVGAGLVQAPKN